jgi:hypothetical protein
MLSKALPASATEPTIFCGVPFIGVPKSAAARMVNPGEQKVKLRYAKLLPAREGHCAIQAFAWTIFPPTCPIPCIPCSCR